MNGRVRYVFPFPIAIIVSSTLDLRFLEEMGAVWLLYMGTYIVSFLFFSTKFDTPDPKPVEVAVSKN